MKKGWSRFCLAAAFIIIALQLAEASFTVTGALCQMEVSPGQEFRHLIDVKIDGPDDPRDYSVEVLGMGQDLNGSTIEISPDSDVGAYTARPFLRTHPRSFHLLPGVHQNITIEIMLPDNISEGERYALVRIGSMPVGGPVAISVAVNVPTIISRKGSTFLWKGEITSMNWNRHSDQIDIMLLFKNTGNIHYRPIVQADLRDAAGNLIAENRTSSCFSSLLPSNTRSFYVALNPGQALTPGKYYLNSSVLLENGTVLDVMQKSLEIDGA